jgi:hypothetical protein
MKHLGSWILRIVMAATLDICDGRTRELLSLTFCGKLMMYCGVLRSILGFDVSDL